MLGDESPCGLSDCSLELGSSEDWTIDASVDDGCFCEGLEELKPVDSCVMIWDAVSVTLCGMCVLLGCYTRFWV